MYVQMSRLPHGSTSKKSLHPGARTRKMTIPSPRSYQNQNCQDEYRGAPNYLFRDAFPLDIILIVYLCVPLSSLLILWK